MKCTLSITAMAIACAGLAQADGPAFKIPGVVVKETNGMQADTSADNRICDVMAGDTADVLLVKNTDQVMQYWTKVRVTSGECAGQKGWVQSSTLAD